MKPVTIISRLGEHEGQSDGTVAYFDRHGPKDDREVRHFVLLNESIKLMHEPWGWSDAWYADLVSIRACSDSRIELTDLYLDIIIEGNGPTYRMIDFEDFAEALADAKVAPQALRDPLQRLQRFLDNHLHGGKDFPPSCIRPYLR